MALLTLQVRTIAVPMVWNPFRLWHSANDIMTDRRPRGGSTQKITGVSVSGEMLNLVNAVSDMIDQFAIFAKCKRGGDGGQARRSGGGGELAVYLARDHVCHLLFPPGILSNCLIYIFSADTMAGNLMTHVQGFVQIPTAAMN